MRTEGARGERLRVELRCRQTFRYQNGCTGEHHGGPTSGEVGRGWVNSEHPSAWVFVWRGRADCRQMWHRSGGDIGSPTEHENASANSGMFMTARFMRKRPAASSLSSRTLSQLTRPYERKNRSAEV